MSYETDIQYKNLTTQLMRATPAFLSLLATDDLNSLRRMVSQLDANIRAEQQRYIGGKGSFSARK